MSLPFSLPAGPGSRRPELKIIDLLHELLPPVRLDLLDEHLQVAGHAQNHRCTIQLEFLPIKLGAKPPMHRLSYPMSRFDCLRRLEPILVIIETEGDQLEQGNLEFMAADLLL